MREGFSRKGAKTQSAAAFLRVFLCAFAPLREKCFLSHVKILISPQSALRYAEERREENLVAALLRGALYFVLVAV
jgi:hypothetical protein